MIDRQSFAYEKGKDGVRILRCYGISGRVAVPRELEGLPVTELADYAFAESYSKIYKDIDLKVGEDAGHERAYYWVDLRIRL